MNRRRIGLGVLAAGAGLIVRRKLRAQPDPGPESADPATESVAPLAAAGTAHAATVEAPVPGEGSTEAPTDLVEPQVVLDPASAELGEPEIELEPGSAELGEPEIELEPGSAELGEPEIGAPEISPAPEAQDLAPPVVVLPTMPRAGTTEVVPPGVVVVPQADGTAPAHVALPGSLPSPAVTASEPAAPTDSSNLATASLVEAPEATSIFESVIPTGNRSPDTNPVEQATDKPAWFRRRFYGWSVLSITLLTLLGVAAFAASVVRLPYYRLQPGSVYDTIERVEVSGDLAFIPEGEIGFVTISQTANITPWQWIDAQLDENMRIRHEDEIRGTQTVDEARATDLRRMQVSKNAAVVVALQRLGYEITTVPIGVEVARVFPCTAADGTLGTGDLIVAVNGIPTSDGERLVAELINVGIGQDVELLVERIDPDNPAQSMSTELVGLTLGTADDPCIEDEVRADEPRPFIGIMTETMYEEEIPIDIDLRTGRVGGPSAGLAFTLAIMDVLSEGELTNGLSIVATGTINRDGEVGPVGGIHQKTVAAERSGADIFLVPLCCDNFVDRESGEDLDLPSNFDEAQRYADDMLVVGVDTLDDALIAIGELGGDVERFLNS